MIGIPNSLGLILISESSQRSTYLGCLIENKHFAIRHPFLTINISSVDILLRLTKNIYVIYTH